jgi:hypothetical protein
VTVATALAVEMLQFQPESGRTQQWFTSLEAGAKAQGIDLVRTTTYRGTVPCVLMWGAGAPGRAEVLRRHVATGGHVIAMDLAYWDRNRKARVSIDAPHPQAWVMRTDLPAGRFKADGVVVGDRWKADGPVIIAGLGEKARVQYGAAIIDRWEHEMMLACKARWPKRRIFYRKKKQQSPVPDWALPTSGQDIDVVLTGASLVVTWHSNVAVDAIRLGVPVICKDGAAAAVCPSSLWPDRDPVPLAHQTRDRFLQNLAWYQWAPGEARALWAFLQERLA